MTPLAQKGEVRAHLLIQAHPGTTGALRAHLQQVPGVVDAASTTGPFDAVARIAVLDERALHCLLYTSQSPRDS